MAFKPTPLMVAAVSGALLIAVLTVDAIMEREYALEVLAVDGWRTVATSDEGGEYPRAIHSRAPVIVEDNSSVEFRLRVDNDYPWAFSGTYGAFVYGTLVGEGVLTAPAGGVGSATFTVDAANLAGSAFVPPSKGQPYQHVYVEVQVNGDVVGGEVAIQEANA